ncbi:interphotoreceptor matrix proteoglycan 2 [Aulostomus maculatus]
MYMIPWRCVFYSALFSWVVFFLDIRTDATEEGSSMGDVGPPYGEEPEVFPHIHHISDIQASHQGHATITRQKRNILFPSGVKLCAQETAQQVVANHLSYFHLRVCQETIWEAFKIFWDRLPEQEEYQSWMNQCQQGTVTAQNIGSYFSQSEEHQALIKKRMSLPGLKSEPTRSWQHMCSTPTPDTRATAAPVPEPEDSGKAEEGAAAPVPEEEQDNDIDVQPLAPAVLEQVVELSIVLTGEIYSEALDDPSSLKYQMLSRQLAEKIEDALENLPGFKSVTVLDFRPHKDAQGLDGVVVDYAVTVLVDGTGVSNDQLDYLTLQSNQVESSYHELQETPTLAYTVSEIKTIVNEDVLVDVLESVSEILEPVSVADAATVHFAEEPMEVLVLEDLEDVKRDELLLEVSESNIVVTTQSDVIILEDSVVIPPAPGATAAEPDTSSIKEEGLLLEDTVETPAVEKPTQGEVLTEISSPDVHEDLTLPEPPVGVEASGSGTGDLSDLLWPSPSTAPAEESSLEVASVLITDVEEEEVVKDEEEEVVVNEAETPEELQVSTIATETIEEDLPALVPAPNTVDVASEASQPESVDTVLPPASEDSVGGTADDSAPTGVAVVNEEVDPEQTAISVVLSQPGEPALEDVGGHEATEGVGGEEVKEQTAPDPPVIIEEAPGAPEITAEDLTEDEILLVNTDGLEPSVMVPLSPAQPTALYPERESPFTRVSDMNIASEGQPDIVITSLVEIQTSNEGLDDVVTEDHGFDVFHYGYGVINHTEEGSTGFPFGVSHGTDQASIAMPVNPGRALMVFFSLRVTNMIFSEDLFNKSSPEYKALEQRFLELLVPYLQSNLSNFENLEILNFRNGSIVVNSRMKFGKPVPRGVTSTVYLILEDFCNTAYQTMNLAIDKYSLDVESGDQADPCKFQACNEYAECKVNKWSGEAECVCNAGYFSVDGLPCQSICELQSDFCLNDGKCDIIPGQGAICRCRVGENWWYRGEHCEEYVSEPLVVGIAVASVAGFLLVASGVIFFLARTLRDQYDKEESEDPIRRGESLPSLERATKYNPMYESEATTGYSHYYRRYPEPPVYSSASAEASTDFSSEEIRHIYENSELTKEEIQDRIRIIELYTKDRQFADFVRQHQAVLDTRRESSSAQT